MTNPKRSVFALATQGRRPRPSSSKEHTYTQKKRNDQNKKKKYIYIIIKPKRPHEKETNSTTTSGGWEGRSRTPKIIYKGLLRWWQFRSHITGTTMAKKKQKKSNRFIFPRKPKLYEKLETHYYRQNEHRSDDIWRSAWPTPGFKIKKARIEKCMNRVSNRRGAQSSHGVTDK